MPRPEKLRKSWGVLRFPLPEEECAFRVAQRAMDVILAVEDFKMWLRGEIKHKDRPDAATLVEVRTKLFEILYARDVPEVE